MPLGKEGIPPRAKLRLEVAGPLGAAAAEAPAGIGPVDRVHQPNHPRKVGEAGQPSPVRQLPPNGDEPGRSDAQTALPVEGVQTDLGFALTDSQDSQRLGVEGDIVPAHLACAVQPAVEGHLPPANAAAAVVEHHRTAVEARGKLGWRGGDARHESLLGRGGLGRQGSPPVRWSGQGSFGSPLDRCLLKEPLRLRHRMQQAPVVGFAGLQRTRSRQTEGVPLKPTRTDPALPVHGRAVRGKPPPTSFRGLESGAPPDSRHPGRRCGGDSLRVRGAPEGAWPDLPLLPIGGPFGALPRIGSPTEC